MTKYIETANQLHATENLNWEIPAVPDLAGLEYGSGLENDALDAILSAFEKVNDVELGWEARHAWEEVARDFYNSVS